MLPVRRALGSGVPLCMAVLAVLLSGSCTAQESPLQGHLSRAVEDLSYLGSLMEADLTEDQLELLSKAQANWAAENAPAPDVQDALSRLLAAVLQGVSLQEELRSQGGGGQVAATALAKVQGMVSEACDELAAALEPEQLERMVWLGSSARGLDDLVSAVASSRKVPDEQWQQIREQLCQGLDHYRRMVDPGA